MKVAVLLANGFEEVEALTVVDYLRRVDISVDMVSITNNNNVGGAHNIEVVSNKVIDEIKESDYKAVIIPGGMPGAQNLKDSSKVIDFVEKMSRAKKLLAAICAGPIVLSKADVIKDKKITSYPGFEKELNFKEYKEEAVVIDDNVITARGPYFAVDFALAIIEYLIDKETAEKVKEDILYKK